MPNAGKRKMNVDIHLCFWMILVQIIVVDAMQISISVVEKSIANDDLHRLNFRRNGKSFYHYE